jgi:hypothetical protein
MNAVFTLCSNNYLGQALTLGKSYLKENSDSEFIIGLVDKYDPSIDYASYAPIRFLTTGELNYPEFLEMQARYNITEFNTAVKPFYFEYLFNHGYEKAIYLDPDIAVYDSLHELFDLLSTHDVLLTPHTLSLDHKQAQRWQRIANQVGIYNLGFLGLKKSANTNELLQWWKKKLEVDCYMIPAEGLFVDQIWANYFPVFFKKSYLIMEHRYNMAYWNFGERTLEKKNGIYWVNGERLKFFHFSNYKMSRHEGISNYTDYTREQRPDIAEIYDEYKAALLANGYQRFSALKPLLKFRSDEKGFYQMTGLRIKVHGTRWFHKFVKTIFGV